MSRRWWEVVSLHLILDVFQTKHTLVFGRLFGGLSQFQNAISMQQTGYPQHFQNAKPKWTINLPWWACVGRKASAYRRYLDRGVLTLAFPPVNLFYPYSSTSCLSSHPPPHSHNRKSLRCWSNRTALSAKTY